jgi:oligoendopeptidase F
MTVQTTPTRAEIAPQYKWNAESVFADHEAWEQATLQLGGMISQLDEKRGHLGEGPAALLSTLRLSEDIMTLLGKIFVYASIAHAVDTADNNATAMNGRAVGMAGQASASTSFIDPELIQVGMETLRGWMANTPELRIYAHYFEDLFRKQQQVRSAEVEELLGMLAPAFYSTSETASLLTDADFHFPAAQASDGQAHEVTQGIYQKMLSNSDRELRRTAWQGYMDTYLAHKNTLANNLNTSIQQNIFNAHARRSDSTLETSLFQYNIPVQVFRNLIETYKRHLPVWHRYFKARRKALGVEKLYTYDIWAPLTANHPAISYEQAIEMISDGLAPMGSEYVQNLRRGVLQDRWVDVYPNQGKSSAQFSSGSKGTHPFIVMNFDSTIFSLSTLAHELGHSMHSFYTWQTQPVAYSDYSLFVAEVASNFHQAMVRANLFATRADVDFQISLIDEAMDNFHRYFFIMPTLARFELEMHERAERGEGLSASLMIERMAELYAEGYGGEVELDPQRDGITWATFGHLYADYYVYQYATGISGANALSQRILSGVPGAAEAYLGFLKAGSSAYPLDVLKAAGVDLTTPAPVEETFRVLEGLVARLEKLVEQR